MVNRSSQDASLDWAVAVGDDGRWWIAPLARVLDGVLALDEEAATLLQAARASGQGEVSVVFADGERRMLGRVTLRQGRLTLPTLTGVGDAQRNGGRIEVRVGGGVPTA